MNNNVIELYRYTDTKERWSNKTMFRSDLIRYWCFTIADTITTLSIGICTAFCVYLAYTMI